MKKINDILNINIQNLEDLIDYFNNNKKLFVNKSIEELIGKPSLNNFTTLDELHKFKNTYKKCKNKKMTNQRLSIYRFDQLAALILCKITNDYNFNGWYYPNIKSNWIMYNNEEYVVLGMYKYFKKTKPENIKKMFSLLKKNILGQKYATVGKSKKKLKIKNIKLKK